MAVSFFVLLLIGIDSFVFARQPRPSDLGDGADVRANISNQLESAVSSATAVTGKEMNISMTPGTTPEKEIERREKRKTGMHRGRL